MKKLLLTLGFMLIVSISFAQSKIDEIDKKIQQLENKIINEGLTGGQEQAVRGSISTLKQEKSNLTISLETKRQAAEQQKEDYLNAQRVNSEQIQKNNNRLQSENAIKPIQQLKIQQTNSVQSFSNELNNLSNSMQNIMVAEVRKNLLERQNLISGFYNRNQVKLNKIFSIYNQIPNESFIKKLNGLYKCYYITQKKYIYANNNEIISVEDYIVNIENDIIKNIYLYGNKETESDLPLKNPIESKINRGIVTYIDGENLETYRIVLLEPYLSSKENKSSLKENKVGYITLWSNNKNDEGKIVYVQELSADKKQLISEISVKINYAKSEKELQNNIEDYPKISINIGNVINYLGEITSTPFGNIPLHTKTSTSVLKPVSSKEHRLVEIKKYRE